MTCTTVAADASLLAHQGCVIDAAVESFAAVCGMNLTQESGTPPPTGSGHGALLGVISLVGDVEWSLTLDLPEAAAVHAASKFAGCEIPFDSGDMGDAIGELTNILAGTAKAKLDACGVKAEISLPTVLRGDRMEVVKSHQLPSVRHAFASPAGPLWVEIVAGKDFVPTRQCGS